MSDTLQYLVLLTRRSGAVAQRRGCGVVFVFADRVEEVSQTTSSMEIAPFPTSVRLNWPQLSLLTLQSILANVALRVDRNIRFNSFALN